MRTSCMFICVISFLCMVFFSFPVFASVTGTVKDTTGNPVSGATVTFIDESDPDNRFIDETDNQGIYQIDIPGTTGVNESKPSAFSLGQNYPNPFNPATTIPFSLHTAGHVTLSIYNIVGQKVRTLFDGYYEPGYHTIIWNGNDDYGNVLSAGIYLYQLKMDNHNKTKKMLLLDGGSTLSAAMTRPTSSQNDQIASFNAIHKKSVTTTIETTWEITITGDDVFPYLERGVVIDINTEKDFVVSIKKESKQEEVSTGEDAEVFTEDGGGIAIPQGAFTDNAIVTIDVTDNLPSEMMPEGIAAVSSMYNFSITSFETTKEKVGVAIPVDESRLPEGQTVEDIVIGTWDGAKWIIEECAYDADNNLLLYEISMNGEGENAAAKISADNQKVTVDYKSAAFSWFEPEIALVSVSKPPYYDADNWANAEDLMYRVIVDFKDKDQRFFDVLACHYSYRSIERAVEKGYYLQDNGETEIQPSTFEFPGGYRKTGYSSDPTGAGDGIYGAGLKVNATTFNEASKNNYSGICEFWIIPKYGEIDWVYKAMVQVPIHYVNEGSVKVKTYLPKEGDKKTAEKLLFFGDAYEYDLNWLGKFEKLGMIIAAEILPLVDAIFGTDTFNDIAEMAMETVGMAPELFISEYSPKRVTLYIDDDNDPYNDPWKLFGRTQKKIDLDSRYSSFAYYLKDLGIDLGPGEYWYGAEVEGDSGLIERSAPIGFTLIDADAEPNIEIISPMERSTFVEREMITFESNRAGKWSSSINGAIAVDVASFTTHLSVGTHSISVHAVNPTTNKLESYFITINVKSAEESLVVRGWVTYEGEGLQGVTVSMGETITMTDENGHYAFTCAETGTYTLLFVKSGYTFLSQSLDITVTNNDITVDTIEATKTGGASGGETHIISGITSITIPAGTFRMGDVENYGQYSNEKPVHSVTLSSFEMSIYEITQGQYQSIMGTNPSNRYGVGDTYPVYKVSWYDAVKFCNKLSDAAGLERCYNESTWACDFSRNGFRLSTEAEWEYACRAGTETNFYTGNTISSDGRTSTDLDRAGWYWYNWGQANNKTHVVGEKEPNAFGLYDMHGNGWEWCNDWYGSYSSGSVNDPTGAQTGSTRVFRGGGWGSYANYCRSAIRFGGGPSRTYDYGLSFRVVRRL